MRTFVLSPWALEKGAWLAAVIPEHHLGQLSEVGVTLEEWFTGAWLVTRGYQLGQSPVANGRAICGRQCGQISRIRCDAYLLLQYRLGPGLGVSYSQCCSTLRSLPATDHLAYSGHNASVSPLV